MIRFAMMIALLLFEVSSSYAAPPSSTSGPPVAGHSLSQEVTSRPPTKVASETRLMHTRNSSRLGRPSSRALRRCVSKRPRSAARRATSRCSLAFSSASKQASPRSRIRSRCRCLRSNRELQETLDSRGNSGGWPINRSGPVFLALFGRPRAMPSPCSQFPTERHRPEIARCWLLRRLGRSRNSGTAPRLSK
jgi:hypothetical protein